MIFKIAAIGIIVATLNLLLIRAGRLEQAKLTTLAGFIVVLSVIVLQTCNLFIILKSVFYLYPPLQLEMLERGFRDFIGRS